MKFIVTELPAYCGDCVFCSDFYCDVCNISKRDCPLSRLEDCPYLVTINEYLASNNGEKGLENN